MIVITHKIEVIASSSTLSIRTLTPRHDDVLLIIGRDATAPTHIQWRSKTTTLPAMPVTAPAESDRLWTVEVPAKLLLQSGSVEQWTLYTATIGAQPTPAEANASSTNYRDQATPQNFEARGSITIVSVAQSVFTTVAMLPAIGFGCIGLLVGIIEPSRLSFGVKLIDITMGVVGMIALGARIFFRHSFLWRKFAIASSAVLSMIAIGLFAIVSRNGRTIRIEARTPSVVASLGVRGAERYFLQQELRVLELQFHAEGALIQPMNAMHPCEQARFHPQGRSPDGPSPLGVVCAHRWIELSPNIQREIGLQGDGNPLGDNCIDTTGPDCVSPEGVIPSFRRDPRPEGIVLQRSEQQQTDRASRVLHPSVTGRLSFTGLPPTAPITQTQSYQWLTWGTNVGLDTVTQQQSTLQIRWQIGQDPGGYESTEFTLHTLQLANESAFTFSAEGQAPAILRCTSEDANQVNVFNVDPTLIASVASNNEPAVEIAPDQHFAGFCTANLVTHPTVELTLRTPSIAAAMHTPTLLNALEEMVIPNWATTVTLRSAGATAGGPPGTQEALSTIDCSNNPPFVARHLMALDLSALSLNADATSLRVTIQAEWQQSAEIATVTVDRAAPLLCIDTARLDSRYQFTLRVLQGLAPGAHPLWRFRASPTAPLIALERAEEPGPSQRRRFVDP